MTLRLLTWLTKNKNDLSWGRSKWKIILNSENVKCEYIEMPTIKHEIMWFSIKCYYANGNDASNLFINDLLKKIYAKFYRKKIFIYK